MLNTDLHIADLNKHMSRTDFVRNSMRAIQESMPPADRSSTPDVVRDDGSSFKFGSGSNTSFAPSSVNIRPKPPTSLPNAPRSASAPVASSPAPPVRNESGSTLDPSHRTGTTTISSFSYSKAWEADAENALKVSVKAGTVLTSRKSTARSEPTGSSFPPEGSQPTAVYPRAPSGIDRTIPIVARRSAAPRRATTE